MEQRVPASPNVRMLYMAQREFSEVSRYGPDLSERA